VTRWQYVFTARFGSKQFIHSWINDEELPDVIGSFPEDGYWYRLERRNADPLEGLCGND
jgi:hypothetical protein